MIDLFTLASWIGGVAFALSGFLIGVRKDMDWMGIFILAFLTANGGGMIRDVMVGKTPGVLIDPSAFILVSCVFVIALTMHYLKGIDIERKSFFVLSDSIGLVSFSVTGALVGVDAGLTIFGVMVLSFITAVGGGILRDVLVNEVPVVFQSDFYGTIALLVGAVIYGLNAYGLYNPVALIAVFIAALTLRIAAYQFGWHLPKIKS